MTIVTDYQKMPPRPNPIMIATHIDGRHYDYATGEWHEGVITAWVPCGTPMQPTPEMDKRWYQAAFGGLRIHHEDRTWKEFAADIDKIVGRTPSGSAAVSP